MHVLLYDLELYAKFLEKYIGHLLHVDLKNKHLEYCDVNWWQKWTALPNFGKVLEHTLVRNHSKIFYSFFGPSVLIWLQNPNLFVESFEKT